MNNRMLKTNDIEHTKRVAESKKGVPEEGAFEGYQMNLFSDFLVNYEGEKARLSNTIELWDATPKYFMERKRQTKIRKEGGFLDTITRPFKHRGKPYEVTITPARISDKKTGQSIEYFPSRREHSVELALRKLATRSGSGFANKYRSGICFTVGELREELANTGHTMSYAQVIECIEILRGCRVIINPLNNHAKIDTSPLSSLVVVGKEDYLKDTSSRWRVDFSMAVTQSINDMSYRQHDYTIVMSLNDLARYLTLRMSHNWTQAAMKDFYPLKYTTIQRDSCLIESNRSDDNRKKLNSAFEEMIAKNRLLNVTEHDEIRGKRNKLIDITYHLHPHPDFVKEQKCANHRHK